MPTLASRSSRKVVSLLQQALADSLEADDGPRQQLEAQGAGGTHVGMQGHLTCHEGQVLVRDDLGNTRVHQTLHVFRLKE